MNKMKVSTIRRNADLIWANLCNHCFWSMDELKDTTNLSEPEVYVALGWLARQGDISFVEIDDKMRVVLAANVYL